MCKPRSSEFLIKIQQYFFKSNPCAFSPLLQIIKFHKLRTDSAEKVESAV